LVSIFRSYHPAVIFILLLYTFLLRLILFAGMQHFQPFQEGKIASGPLYNWLCHILHVKTWLYHVVAILMIFFQALYFNYLVNFYRILSRQSYLPAFSYLLIGSLFVEFLYFSPVLLANTFLLLSVSKMFSAYKKENAIGFLFDAALYISIASLFFFPYIVFIGFILFATAILRPFNLREYLIAIIGAMVPYYFLGVYLFWEGRLYEFVHSLIIPELRFDTDVLEKSIRIFIESVPVFFVLIWSAIFIQANLFKMVVQVRNYFILLVIFFFAGVCSLLILFKGEVDHFFWIAIPAGIAFALFFTEYKRRAVSEIVHFFLILAILFFQYYNGFTLK